jgi:hypothetical protein
LEAENADGHNVTLLKPYPPHARRLARDLLLSAAHEAAHVVVARQLGVDAFAWLWMRGASDTENDRLVLGRCQLLDTPASEHHYKLIGVAGAVGELLLYDPDFCNVDVHKIMSRADRENAGAPDYNDKWSWAHDNAWFADTVLEVRTLLRGELAREWWSLARQLRENVQRVTTRSTSDGFHYRIA